MPCMGEQRQRVLLLMPSSSYRARAYLEAARRLEVELVVGSDHCSALGIGEGFLTLDFMPLGEGVARILEYARKRPIDAVIGTDDATVLLAASAGKALRLPHSPLAAVAAARDKYRFRQALMRAGVRSPWFRRVSVKDDFEVLAHSVAYPCVLKPLALSASRGVMRADDARSFVEAGRRLERILRNLDRVSDVRHADSILIEGFIPGRELALEGLLQHGRLHVLALFDKPDPLDGPFFEETLYVSPARLSEAHRDAITLEVARAATALGLTEGPIHAELRVNECGAWMLELAARAIGGLCSRALCFEAGASLEELILRHALGRPFEVAPRTAGATGVMMIPIPCAGRLCGVRGLDTARATPGVEDLVISASLGEWLQPLPEGDRYLGFIFASGASTESVETALRSAHCRLAFDIAVSKPGEGVASRRPEQCHSGSPGEAHVGTWCA